MTRSGGLNTQLSFHHQNLFCILMILKYMKDDSLVSAKIEQPIDGNPTREEIDLILVRSGESEITEYYEVKSGASFTCTKDKIVKTVNKLFLAYKLNLADRAFIISDIDFKRKVIEIEDLINKVSTGNIESRNLTKLLALLGLPSEDRNRLFEFCGRVTFDYEKKLKAFKNDLSLFIDDIRKQVCPNADQGIDTNSIISVLNFYLLDCLENNDGIIDLNKITEIITDWAARNMIAYRLADESGDRRRIFNRCWTDAKEKITSNYCKSFPPQHTPGIFTISISEEIS
jgi:hypothetical protein